MSEVDLLTRICFRLQDRKQGQTPAQLSEHFNVPESIILAALHNLRTTGEGAMEGKVWKYTGHE